MNELIIALLAWLAVNTSYDVNVPHPNVVMTTRHNLCQLYGITDYDDCNASGVRAFYDKKLTICLGMDFNLKDNHKISGLLHELAHYVQFLNHKHDNTCLGQLAQGEGPATGTGYL